MHLKDHSMILVVFVWKPKIWYSQIKLISKIPNSAFEFLFSFNIFVWKDNTHRVKGDVRKREGKEVMEKEKQWKEQNGRKRAREDREVNKASGEHDRKGKREIPFLGDGIL